LMEKSNGTWYDMILYEMTWNDMIFYEMTWNGMEYNDMKKHEYKLREINQSINQIYSTRTTSDIQMTKMYVI
jgi:hypothetical protein